MYPDGQPVVVPQRRIIEKRSEDGLAHWCGVLGVNGSAKTHCAILPMQSVQLNLDIIATSVCMKQK